MEFALKNALKKRGDKMVEIRVWEYPDSYIMINGEKKLPGDYTVRKGDVITVMINAKNHGTSGTGWLGVMDKKISGTMSDQIAWWQSYSNWKTNEVKYYSKGITVDRDMELYLVGGALTTQGRIVQDTYGVWRITVAEAEQPTQPPTPAPPEEGKGILGLPWYVWVLLLLGAAFLFIRQRGE